MNETNDNEIIILCKRNTITDTQKELLKKGLSFVPKPKDTNITNYIQTCANSSKNSEEHSLHTPIKKRDKKQKTLTQYDQHVSHRNT